MARKRSGRRRSLPRIVLLRLVAAFVRIRIAPGTGRGRVVVICSHSAEVVGQVLGRGV